MMKRTIVSGCLIGLIMPLSVSAQTDRNMTVSELFSLVESGSRSLRTQKTGLEVADKAVEEAKSQRLPDINASLSLSYNGNVVMMDRDFSNATAFSSPHFGNSFALEAQQVVYAGGAINAGIRLAEVQKRQAETGVTLTRSQQRFMALGQYLDIFKLDNSIKVYESNITLTEKLIADINEKHAQGMALKNDVTRYELQMETLKLGLRKLQDQRAVLNYQLCNTLGLENVTIIPDQNVINESLADDNEAAWQSRAAMGSPVLQQSSLGIEAAKEQLKIAKSDLLPKVSIVAADNFSGPFTYDLPPVDNNFNIWYVGVGVKYSLSSLFKSNKSIRRAEAAVRQTQDSHSVNIENVDNQMQQYYTLYKQSYVDLRTQQKSVELANQNYQVMNDRYLNQLALVTDMVDASNIKLNAELLEVDARINIVYAYYKMKYVAGEI
ncbi:MAG: TolC family protein [Prevotellaceae bacterium]|nr:TolC family protein [Prevotellaceae bacterium]